MNIPVQQRIGRFFPPVLGMLGSDSQRIAITATSTIPEAASRNPSYEIYYRHLSVKGLGTPLWLPEPNETKHINYRRRGAGIGDVILFTANGGLDFLFNICLDANDPINGNKVPEGFSPFRPGLDPDDIRRFQEYGEHEYLSSKSITKKRDLMGPAGLWFQSSASEGAILTMPEGAYSEELARNSGFNRYLADNLDSWYHYVNEVREWGVEQGQLRLVTGVHKAKAWGIATFSNERTTSMDLHMIFKSNDNISSGDLYSWEYEGFVDSTRAGPTRRQRRMIFEGLPEAEREPFGNQCLFVRTVNATVRKPEPVKIDGISVPASHANNICSTTIKSADSAGPNHSSSSQDGFDEVYGTCIPDSSGGLDSWVIVGNGSLLRDHPSKAINDFLLKEKPNGRIAITHDQDWIYLLTKDDVSLPSGDELVARLKNVYKIIENEGIIVVEHKDSQLKITGSEGQSVPDEGFSPRSGEISPTRLANSIQISVTSSVNEAHSDTDGSTDLTYLHHKSDKSAPLPTSLDAISNEWAIRLESAMSPPNPHDTMMIPGATMNMQGEDEDSALQMASYEGDEAIVKLLLQNGADVNAEGGQLGSALQAASRGGHETIVKLLLQHGADVNAQGGQLGNALTAASYEGHEAIVKLLLDMGADVSAQGGHYGQALQAASYKGHEAIVKLLLETGANINAQGGELGTALQAASDGGYKAIVKLLLDNGADVNGPGGHYTSALQAASYGGHEAIVQLLLDRGADVNAQKGRLGSALQAASLGGHRLIVKLLLEEGANVNAQGGDLGTALQAASHAGHESIVRLLLEKGADVNVQGGEYGNALQEASYEGHKAIVQLLLEMGMDVNAQRGQLSTALQAASYRGHEAIVNLLVDMGADVNARGGYYGHALQAASFGGHRAIVKFLLEMGADVDAQGGELGTTALQAASYRGHELIVKLLLEKGANLNAQNALQAASYRGHELIVKLLLESGMEANAQEGQLSEALEAALLRGHEAIAKLLQEKGVGVKGHVLASEQEGIKRIKTDRKVPSTLVQHFVF